MLKFLKILAPAGLGAAGMLGLAYTLADQFVVDLPAPMRETVATSPANAQEKAEEPDTAENTADAAQAEQAAPAADMALAMPEGGFGIGREALPEEVAAWDIDIRPDGQGLPEGSGDVWTGEEIFTAQCASCHGDFGEGSGRWPQLAMGQDTLAGQDPVKTVGSYWPYLSTVYDYVHRAMPFGNAQSLSPDEVYALTAYILYLNSLVEDDFVLSKANFTDIEMPNADGFYMDDRAQVELVKFSGDACMSNCNPDVEISMHARVLDVTPEGDGGEATETGATGATEAETAETEMAAAETEPPDAEAQETESEAAEAETAAESETGAPEAAKPETATQESAAETAAAFDPALAAKGEKVFRQCKACHQVGEGAQNRAGPQLNGVIGRPIGGLEDFRYSKVFSTAHDEGRVWTEAELSAFLADPRGTFKGTKMGFRGLKSEEDIAAIIAYLKSIGQ